MIPSTLQFQARDQPAKEATAVRHCLLKEIAYAVHASPNNRDPEPAGWNGPSKLHTVLRPPPGAPRARCQLEMDHQAMRIARRPPGASNRPLAAGWSQPGRAGDSTKGASGVDAQHGHERNIARVPPRLQAPAGPSTASGRSHDVPDLADSGSGYKDGPVSGW